MKRTTSANAASATKTRRRTLRGWLVGLSLLLLGTIIPAALVSPPAYAAPTAKSPSASTKYQCGSGKNAVKTSINIGCYGASCKSTNAHGCSAILDATFAIIRLLSAGVGIVVVGSIVWAGLQYMSARDDPGAVGKAKDRIRNSLIALLIFIFGYAILNYVIPAGFFR
jgi:hypothetical protein